MFVRNKVTKYHLFYIMIFFTSALMSCKKDWLEERTDNSLTVPSSLKDFQSLLNNSEVFNVAQPGLGEIGAGDFNTSYESWSSLYNICERNSYIWAKDIYGGQENVGDWNGCYTQVFNANIVLEGTESIKVADGEKAELNSIKGSALFFRAYAFYHLLQTFSKPYDPTTANTDLGIPLRLHSDINEKSSRSSVQACYDQILEDLNQAKVLLPENSPFKTRPTKTAVHAFLARIFLSMENYEEAFKQADSCLQTLNSLIDYNSLDPSMSQPIPAFNDEVIFVSYISSYGLTLTSRLIVEPSLLASYADNDLRRKIFFRMLSDHISFKGSYSGSRFLYGGLATDEILLIRAECYARIGNVSASLDDLNHLLEKRMVTGTFVPVTAGDAEEALRMVISERRKELCFRGIRWVDLRRLNRDPRFAVTLSRTLNNQTYSLPPNDPRYILPLPDEVIRLTGMPQNPR